MSLAFSNSANPSRFKNQRLAAGVQSLQGDGLGGEGADGTVAGTRNCLKMLGVSHMALVPPARRTRRAPCPMPAMRPAMLENLVYSQRRGLR